MSKRPSAINNDPGYFYQRRKLGKLFLFGAVLLMGSMVWMVLQDFDRPWKDEQRAEMKWEAKKLAFEGFVLEARTQDARDSLEKGLKKAKKAVADKKKELDELEQKIRDAEGGFYSATMAYNSQKQYTIQAEWQVHEAQSTEDLAYWRKKLTAERNKEHLLRDARQYADAQLKALLQRRKSAYKAMDDIIAAQRGNPSIKKLELVNASKERKRAYNPAREIPLLDFLLPPTKVEQVVLDDIVDDYEFARPKKVDRCVTCHIGSPRLGFEAQKWPLAAVLDDKSAAAFEAGIYRVVNSLLESVWPDKVDPKSPYAYEEELQRKADIHHATLDTLFADYDPETGEIGCHEEGKLKNQKIWKRYERKGDKWVAVSKGGERIADYYYSLVQKLEGKGHWLTHPHFDDMVGTQSPHPYERVGCTICHQGRGWSTDFGRAWHRPGRVEVDDWMTEERAHDVHAHLPINALRPLDEAMLVGALTAYERAAWDRAGSLEAAIAKAKGEAAKPLQEELSAVKATAHFKSAAEKAASLKIGWVTDKKTKERWAEELGRNKTKLKYWHWPQLPKMLVQASCLKCHKEGLYRTAQPEYATARIGRPDADAPDTFDWQDHAAATNADLVAELPANRMLIPAEPEAYRPANLERGLDNFMRFGCYGCHKVDETKYPFMANARAKVGPPLDEIMLKATKEWARKWVRNPKDYRADTRMPRFWGLSNNSHDFKYRFADEGQGDVNGGEWAEAEIYSIVEWLYAESRKHAKAQPPVAWQGGDPKRGEAIFRADGQATNGLAKACIACHDMGDGKDYGADKIAAGDDNKVSKSKTGWQHRMSRRQGPNLAGLGSKLNPEWLYRWLQKPQGYWHETNMPDLRLSDDEIKDLIAYLTQQKHDDFDKLPDVGFNLATIDRIAKELKVAEQKETTREALDVVAKWRRDHSESGNKGDDPVVMYVGKKLFKHYGCFGCHSVQEYKDATPIGTELTEWGSKLIERLEFNHAPIEHERFDFAVTKMRNPRIFDFGMPRRDRPFERLRMPRFGFTKEEARDLATFLVGLVNDPITEEAKFNPDDRQQAIIRGREIVSRYNCQSCHVIEGEGGDIWPSITGDQALKFRPPDLLGQGFKTQPDWLFKFFKNPAFLNDPSIKNGDRVRPWHSIRMPTFPFTDEEATSLVRYFEALSSIPNMYQTPPADGLAGAGYDAPVQLKLKQPDDRSKEYTFRARNRVEEARALFQELQCKSCHAADAALANAAPGFRHSRAGRLRDEWIVAWLWNPSLLQPGTSMPTFFANEDGPIVQDNQFFKHGGDAATQPDRQIKALRDYIRHYYREEDR